MSDTPYWYQTLKHFEVEGYVHNGLTIPFLIGAKKILVLGSTLPSVREFIEEMSSSIENRQTTIMTCSNIGEYIIGLLDEETNQIRKRYSNLYKEFDSLICTDQSFDNFDNLTEVITVLDNRYSNYISDGLFSKNNGIWADFSQTDLDRLNELI